MTIFLWTVFIIYMIRLCYFTYKLSQNDYPRIVFNDPNDDVARLLISIGFGAWVGYILFIM